MIRSRLLLMGDTYMKQYNKYKRLANAVGIIMVLTAVAGFIALKDAERVARSAWQTVYMVFILMGGIVNLFDNNNDSRARCACLSYIAASLLSAAIGIVFRGGIHADFLLIFVACLISLIRYGSILKEKKENDIDTKIVNSHKPAHEIHRKSYEAVSIPLDSIDRISPKKSAQFDFEFTSTPIEIPKHFTEKEYAQFLIENTKEYAHEINSSIDVTDFVSCFKMIKENLEELAWLNEEKKIFMYPTPRNDFQKIYNNIENTIKDFISRAIAGIGKSGTEWVEDAEFLI